jgi:hypothetical protein
VCSLTEMVADSASDSASPTSVVPLPDRLRGEVVVEAPGDGPGYWAGAPSVVFDDGIFHLAYRLRRPVGEGRGYATIVARSTDGVHFEEVLSLGSEQFGAASLERPALVKLPDGGWRLYISCATPGSLHWQIGAIDADDPAGFRADHVRTVLPGDEHTAVKDPFVLWSGGRWHLWASCHPLPDPSEADRMVTEYATSADGLAWSWGQTALTGRAGMWDSRGVRVTCVIVDGDSSVAYYDGRASAADNAEERTGLAISNGDGVFHATSDQPAAVSPYGSGSLRYVSLVDLGEGACRLFYEATDPGGAHSLYSEYVAPTS